MGLKGLSLDRLELCAGDVTQSDLERIIVMSGLGTPSAGGRAHSVFRVVEFGGRPFKVRAYRSPQAAQRRFKMVCRVRHLFPQCYGRIGHCLLWEYARDFGVPPGRNLVEDMAGFLVELARVESDPLSEATFFEWCEEIRQAGILRSSSVDRVRRYFSEVNACVGHWNFEYLDAVPKNFIYDASGRLLSIDAKHLCPGPRGLGLLKLECHRGSYISEEDYARFAETYRARLPVPEYSDARYFGFLMFYYCMVLLADNARDRSRWHNFESERNRWRKRKLLETISAPRWLWWVEETLSAVPFYAARAQNKLMNGLRLVAGIDSRDRRMA